MGIFSLFSAKKGWQQIRELAEADLSNVPTPNLHALMAHLDKMQDAQCDIVSKSAKDTERSVDLLNALMKVSSELGKRE